MISESLIVKAIEFSTISGPIKQHVELSNLVGQELAQNLKADQNIVLLGTALMDCQIAAAIKENRLSDHIQMSHDAAKKLLDSDPEITVTEKHKVLNCILEHHGHLKFSSLESEIVCNADCYRFASLRGFYCLMRYFRDMPDQDLLKIAKSKLQEKSAAITLDIVKTELEPQIKIITNFLKYL